MPKKETELEITTLDAPQNIMFRMRVSLRVNEDLR